MKKPTDYTLYLLFGIFLLCLIASCPSCNTLFSNSKPSHICIDPTHNTCDGNCECDGLECPPLPNKVAYQRIPARDYQIEIVEDTLLIFDGTRLVGTIPFESHDAIGALIEEDNH